MPQLLAFCIVGIGLAAVAHMGAAVEEEVGLRVEQAGKRGETANEQEGG